MRTSRMGALGVGALFLGACGDGRKAAAIDPDERVTEPLPAGEALEAPADTWTWVDFPDARCMDDSATGLGVMLHPASDKVLIYIQGGGACFNLATCAVASNPNGFGEKDLAANVNRGVLDESDPDNPFRDWNKVFIPYCSGDIFSGAASDGTGYGGRTQAGYLNMRAYLTRLVPTFDTHSQIVLGGYSAGGFAATVNWVQAIEGFGAAVRVDVLNDSGPPLGTKYLTPCLQKRLAELWNWAPSIPKSCKDCNLTTGNVTEPVMKWAASRTRDRRIALISSSEDAVIKLFYGYGQDNCANLDGLLASYPEGLYPEGLRDLEARLFKGHPGFSSFVVESSQHVWTMQSPGTVTSDGVQLTDFLNDFLDPNAPLKSVAPW